MNLLLHTIALEPARWTPQRVSRPLLELLPSIAASGFRDLEIYEPHLNDVDLPALSRALAGHGLVGVVLSSYLDLRPATLDEGQFAAAKDLLERRIQEIGVRKVRFFPSGNPTSLEGREIFFQRLQTLANAHPHIEFLLETHDGSLADDPQLLTDVVTELNLLNVRLLYQPTLFEATAAWEQFQIQKPLIRHLHLQNRHPDLSFSTLRDGVIDWSPILAQTQFEMDATLEFVPSGICKMEDFDLETTLREASAERDYLQSLEHVWRAGKGSATTA